MNPKDFNNPRFNTLYKTGKVPGDLVKKLFIILSESVPTKIVEINQALLSLDWEVLIRHPHSLKSSFANLGLDNMAALWKELEFLGKANDLANYQEKFKLIIAPSEEAVKIMQDAALDFSKWHSTINE